MGNSIKYTGMEELYNELKEHRVYINRNMVEKMPMMASAVYSEDDMQLIIMLWGVPWERMTLRGKPPDDRRLSDPECGRPCQPLSGCASE